MIDITLVGKFHSEVSVDLAELRDKLVENGIETTATTLSVPGAKAELLIGIAIVGASASSISMIINVINFWRSQRPSGYRVSFEVQDQSLLLDEASGAVVAEAVAQGRLSAIKIEKV